MFFTGKNISREDRRGELLLAGNPEFMTSGASFEGLNCGVPTRTTPTLTPTTLRNIEQTFIELQCQVESHHNQAGFVPPVVQPASQGVGSLFMSLVDTKSWQGGSATLGEAQKVLPLMTTQRAAPTGRRNVGGRRPIKDKSISPEEEERRQVRRERNKLAAARCRKRRMDHTQELEEETQGLEDKKQHLQNEIEQLQLQKEELEFLLEAHKSCCKRFGRDSPPDIKPFVFSSSISKLMLAGEPVKVKQEPELMGAPLSCASVPKKVSEGSKQRPNSLAVAGGQVNHRGQKVIAISEGTGIPISTPTTGIPFNFDSLMDGGTGLTPISGPLVPSCATQLRNSAIPDLSSPDVVPNKLVSL